jgi:creatinine amidohydrolase
MGYRTVDMLKAPPFSLISEFDEISENGVIGMPELATAEKGAQFLDAAVRSVVSLLDEMEAWQFQKRT